MSDNQLIQQRKYLHSLAAEAYGRTRPSYPKLIHQVVEITQLSADSQILEWDVVLQLPR